ncbi:MAG: nuclear transport factor 2 family protein [Solirubrobacterales bacterium]
MSQANVEIVRRAIGAVLRQPKPDWDIIRVLYHPDHELVSMVDQLEGGVAEGGPGFRDWRASIDETWERWEGKLEQVRSIDRDRVLVDCTFAAVSKLGGVPVEEATTTIVTVREGKIARSEVFVSRDEALQAAGLSG